MRGGIDRKFIICGLLLALVGMSLGLTMVATSDYTHSKIHAHINLLGFAVYMIFGLVYRSDPRLSSGRVPQFHFLLLTIGFALFIAGWWMWNKQILVGPILKVIFRGGATLVIGSFVLFLWHFLRCPPADTSASAGLTDGSHARAPFRP